LPPLISPRDQLPPPLHRSTISELACHDAVGTAGLSPVRPAYLSSAISKATSHALDEHVRVSIYDDLFLSTLCCLVDADLLLLIRYSPRIYVIYMLSMPIYSSSCSPQRTRNASSVALSGCLYRVPSRAATVPT
jgi:hypothetical protein